jgi:hypothetical protein
MDEETQGFGVAWTGLSLAFALHVADEAANDFLGVYNPAVTALRETLPWLILPRFDFRVWLGGLVASGVILFALIPAAERGAAWLRAPAIAFALLMTGNALLHLLGSLVQAELLPGTLSAPLLLLAAVLLLRRIMNGPVPAARGEGEETHG